MPDARRHHRRNIMLDSQTLQTLAAAARQTASRAYAPYSQFHVGAALLTTAGQTFVGCNIENASYGATICAERVAASTALAAGQRQWAAMAIATRGGVAPCGICRQFLSEFAADLPIVLLDTHTDQQTQTNLSVLLPSAFGHRDLPPHAGHGESV